MPEERMMIKRRDTSKVHAIMPGTNIKKQEGARALVKKKEEGGPAIHLGVTQHLLSAFVEEVTRQQTWAETKGLKLA